MSKTGINYLFPPDEIHNLPTSRFILQFKTPLLFRGSKVKRATERLKTVEWKIIRIAGNLDSLEVNPKTAH